MAVIYMPKRQDAWAQMLPQILGQMVQTKFQHNLAMKKEDARLKQSQVAKNRADIRELEIKGWQPGKGEGAVTIGDQSYVPPKLTYDIEQEGGRDVFVQMRNGRLHAVQPLKQTSSSAEYQKKINDLVTTFGVSREEATKVVLGLKSIQTDPVTGEHSLIDIMAKSQTILSPAGTQPPKPGKKTKEQTTLWDLAGLVAGPVSAARAGASKLTGMVGLPIAPKTVQARQYVRNAQSDLIRALAINPKFTSTEIKRIKDDINIDPQVFDNESNFHQRLIAIEDYLQTRVGNERRASTDRNLPVDTRRQARQAANMMENFIDIMGIPVRVQTEEEYEKIPSGTRYIHPDGSIRRKK